MLSHQIYFVYVPFEKKTHLGIIVHSLLFNYCCDGELYYYYYYYRGYDFGCIPPVMEN